MALLTQEAELQRFPDRREAGRRFAEQLSDYKKRDCVVLALPRGGVPVAAEIAKQLLAPLDLLMVPKFGAPGLPEFAVGAVVDGTQPQHVMNDYIPKAFRPTDDYVDTEISRLTAEIERRRQRYLGDHKPVPVAGRIAACICDAEGQAIFTPADVTGDADPDRGPLDGNLTVALLSAIAEVTKGKTTS